MNPSDVLKETAQRPTQTAAMVLKNIDETTLNAMPGDAGNSIAWLLWHSGRQMDVQTVALTGKDSVWSSGDWAQRLGVDRGDDDFGFGDSREQVAALHITDPAALQGYLEACTDAFTDYLDTLTDKDLDDVVDDSYEPPVTRGVRLVSIIDDATTHLGQAAYARGLVDDWSIGF